MEHTLDVEFQQSDLQTIHAAGEKVLIATTVDGQQGNVVWVAFSPFQANTVHWEEQYGIYASTVSLVDGGEIRAMAQVPIPAAPETLYTLLPDGSFSDTDPTSEAATDAFYALNAMPASAHPALTFGLTKSAVVNGYASKAAAINAQSVPAQQHAAFTPGTDVYIWLASDSAGQTVLGEVFSRTTKVEFGGSIVQQTLLYDASTGGFVVKR